MTWKNLTNTLVVTYHPALVAEKVVSLTMRRRIHRLLNWLVALSGIGAIVLAPAIVVAPLTVVGIWDIRLIGLFFLCLVPWIISACFRALYYYYADGQYVLATILYHSRPADPVEGFLRSSVGKLSFARLGATTDDVATFLKNRPAIISAFDLSFVDMVDVVGYARALFSTDAALGHFIASYGATEADFVAALQWVLEDREQELARERWWSREWLGRIRGIGTTWQYGRLPDLEKFSRPLPPRRTTFYGDKELVTLEKLLRRSEQANAFLVGDNLEEKLDIIAELAGLIEEGQSMPELAHAQLVILDTDLLISAAQDMSSFEQLTRTLGNEAAAAGNVILVFLDFPAFVAAGERYGLDIPDILDPFFTAPELHIIAVAAGRGYHMLTERFPALSERFGEVFLESTGPAGTLRALQREAVRMETRTPIFFTYQALQALVESGDRYIVAGLQPEKSLNLLRELVPNLGATAGHARTMIRREDVQDFLHTKTGIPMGAVDEGERVKLLQLEKILQQRIIGQDEAVRAVAAAVRRARSGINNPDRPLGSFLFLGPTGVGKTETTKVLADVFFGHGATGGEASVERLDMSEYASADSLEKLIGRTGGAPGILADRVREHPYGVLLLDEFEKTTAEVENLFLQILDEGFFSDGEGERVNCRNLLIIATSNAGAELIWDAVREGKDLSHSRELILDALVHQGIFRPELLNRFDGVIIFHPLAAEQLGKIARLQLEKLAARLADRGVRLTVTDDLVRFVVQFGMDPKFGARPMARAIQNTVEQAVADKIIAGNIKSGDDVVLSMADLIAVHNV